MVDWLLLGIAVGIALTMGFFALRQAYIRKKLKNMFTGPTVVKKASGKTPPPAIPDKALRFNQRKKDTKTIKYEKSLFEREARLEEMLDEMRQLILNLADIIANTNSASGEVSDRFAKAKLALENMEIDSDINLNQVKLVLLTEIDKMVKSNEALKHELAAAHSGMNNQEVEIAKLKAKAHIDTLTQMLNRAAFDEALRQVYAKWKEFQDVFSLLMLDVDHFKKVNDNYGHLHGDRILREIAAKIKDNIRDNDIAARYGGEEFAVIFPDTPAEEALIVGTRVREAIERAHFHIDGMPIRMTISGGISQVVHGVVIDEMIDNADKALYKSKNRGRNRITLGEDRIKESWTSGEGR